ncbi:MAG: hypothetical protein LBQ55_10875 [Treponema sp.]|jgi:hypothetical protein|nr:hypothetical protein [Treponema sp.]
MANIINFPLRGEYEREWNNLIEYFQLFLNESLSKITKVEVFVPVDLVIQFDAIVANYLFNIDNNEYRLSFIMPFINKLYFLNVCLYEDTKFIIEYNFNSFEEFENNFVIWFDKLSVFGGD